MRPILGLLIILFALLLYAVAISRKMWWVCLGLFILFALAAAGLSAQQPQGFILRGTLTSVASDGSAYYQVGEALILMAPKDSALMPGLRALDGKKIIVSVLPEDRP